VFGEANISAGAIPLGAKSSGNSHGQLWITALPSEHLY